MKNRSQWIPVAFAVIGAFFTACSQFKGSCNVGNGGYCFNVTSSGEAVDDLATKCTSLNGSWDVKASCNSELSNSSCEVELEYLAAASEDGRSTKLFYYFYDSFAGNKDSYCEGSDPSPGPSSS